MNKKHDPRPLPEGAVVSDSFKRPVSLRMPLLGRLKASRRAMKIVVILVVVALAGTVGYLLMHKKDVPAPVADKEAAYTMSDKDFAKTEVTELKKIPPAAEAPIQDQLDYYDKMIASLSEAEDYQGVVDAYTKVTQIAQGKPLSFNSYITTAKAYAKVGDKQAGLSVLDKAQAGVKATEKDADLLKAFLQVIDTTKKEIGS